MGALDTKLNDIFAGRVVRKDLVQQVKKGTNVPTFVLEFLLAKYCASNDPDEIQAGIQTVFEYLGSHYVRPDESNKAQSTVQQKGTHKFVDKVHVTTWKVNLDMLRAASIQAGINRSRTCS